jgi:hypothetical protein
LFLGRWWQALLYNPGGFQQEFHSLRLSHAFAIFTAVIGAISFLPAGIIGTLAAEFFNVTLILFFLQALAVVHAIVHIKHMSVGWLVGLYILSPILLKLIGVVGFIDTWAKFREKVRGSVGKS